MINLINCKCGKKWQDIAPVILRVVTGLIFTVYGYQKITGSIDQFGGFLVSLKVPLPIFFAYTVTAVELVGGIVLILGLLTHLSSKLLLIDMLVALFLVHVGKGFYVQQGGYEFVLILIAALLSLIITGPGKWALDNKLFKQNNEQ